MPGPRGVGTCSSSGSTCASRHASTCISNGSSGAAGADAGSGAGGSGRCAIPGIVRVCDYGAGASNGHGGTDVLARGAGEKGARPELVLGRSDSLVADGMKCKDGIFFGFRRQSFPFPIRLERATVGVPSMVGMAKTCDVHFASLAIADRGGWHATIGRSGGHGGSLPGVLPISRGSCFRAGVGADPFVRRQAHGHARK